LKALLEAAAAQQAESSASRQHSEHGWAGAPSAHGLNPPPPQQQGKGDGVGAAASAVKSHLGPHRDARHTIEARRRAESVDNNNDNRSLHNDDRGRRRRHDSDDDRERSWSPNQRGPRAFGRSIRDAKFPSRFRALTNVPRYNGDTDPSVWLVDYRLACHTGGATDDLFVIENLLLYLGDSARTWLEHLPCDKIQDWKDLHRVFIGNFQGTYMRPGKQWELRNCKQQPRESLRGYIQRFSKRWTELPGATDNDGISAFQNGTTCTSLIHRLGRRMPRMTRELLDIASNHADGEEAVATTLNTPQGKGKQVVDQGEGTSSRFKKNKNDKRRRDDNFVATVECKASRPKGNQGKTALTKDHFEKLLDAPCPHHEVPDKHTLRECQLMKNYVKSTLKPKMADQPNKQGPSHDNNDDAGAMFPGEDGAVHMIFGGSPAIPSRRREKLIRREVMNADAATPSYLKWLEVPITFDRKDHPDVVPQPGSYPLVVAPLFKSRRIHKVRMDGGKRDQRALRVYA
jgi:hypothetical protein